MSKETDFEKTQKEILENIKRVMSQASVNRSPESEKETKENEEKAKSKRRDILKFSLKPKDVKAYLDRFVIEQDEAKRVLATAVCDHYNVVRQREEGKEHKNYSKQNILMLGPTGVGKTYLIKCLADLIGVPFVKADATKFSETGYVGGDVEDVVRDLVQKAEGDMELAQYGIVYIDEIDKIASASNLNGRDVSGTGVQRGLLKIMEETEVSLRASNDIQSQIQAMMEFQQKGRLSKPVINTRHILFIVSGAFEPLGRIIDKRMRSKAVGFGSGTGKTPENSGLFRAASTEDFIEFGFEPEFIGRLPVRAVCDPLTEENLHRILAQSEGSVLHQYQESFNAYGVKMEVKDCALREIARRASAEKTGARSLLTICEKILRDFKYELPSSKVKVFTLDARLVESPELVLKGLLETDRREKNNSIDRQLSDYEENFAAKNGITISFDDAARDTAHERIEEQLSVKDFLDGRLKNYPYGLGLIQKKKGQTSFVLGPEVIIDPDAALDKLVKAAYEKHD